MGANPSSGKMSEKPAMSANPVPGAGSGGDVEVATFAGGCFWGLERWFRKEFGDALKSTAVGYVGGSGPAEYRAVCSGTTGYAEAIQIEFFPSKTSYKALLEYFFKIHDPTTLNRQGNDVGTQYRSGIWTHSPDQKEVAQQVKAEMASKWASKGPIVTEIVDGQPEDFKMGEEYHQLYLEKNPGGYCNHMPRW
uniref:peptide-methionine (S)-S-oxide reductase n=1 Tax=Chromera velia CCMP2878 TaxID=1169474 RepID=A0A0G4HI25_9ALVE|eukprot:Cvel_27700.t1-p1 / transcript=Cvel_27700.t1 / gene=Cvel_27700 / organism=Chromera_velia_CCMP2878 / gene_product=Peptide methionine sulfoxide reductase MsrA, putative / transcript_product=Peptide methionine sulfoxide reductase MsrA, putative / location=Cvel_scaffold3499:1470-6006(-) / protein_length=192 / sequence_SO=supercontig / SO=protein_coding / is_pseudo=false